MPQLLSVIQAAEELGVSRSRVQALIAEGRLPAEKVGNQYVVKQKDLGKVRIRKPGRPVGSDGGKPGPKPKSDSSK